MKILIVGSNKSWAIERFFIAHLRRYGAEVHLYAAPDIVFDNHSRNLLNKILFKTRIRTGYSTVNRGLLEQAYLIKPDVIWIWKGMEIYPDTIQALKEQGIRMANFNPDHPFIITSAGSGNKNVTNSVGLFDLHFCYHRKLADEIRDRFRIPAIFLPFAYDTTDLVYTDPTHITEIKKIAFQGNPDKYRERMIALLADNGFEVDVYGNDWGKTSLITRRNVRIYPVASRPAFWIKNQEYRIQLNLFRRYNEGSHNMRTFEIPAVGGIQLSEFSTEQADFFRENEEIFFFRNENEMIQKVTGILEMPDGIAADIRRNARKRSVESGYTFADRAKTVYQEFENLK